MEELPAQVTERLYQFSFRERAVAYLQADAHLNLVAAGGQLDLYGLSGLRLGEPILDQVVFLEGLLPLVETPCLLPALELHGGRAADLHLHLEGDAVWILLLEVTAQRDAVRPVQQRAYDMTLLREKEALLNRRLEAANAALLASQLELEASRAALACSHERLQRELREAALYVRSLLPTPMSVPFTAVWRFAPSTELGGDALGYHWIDAEHFALYLLDVCGHGIGPSLLSIAVLHLLQAGSMQEVNFRDPGQVLAALNTRYQMKSPADLYFTLWYGVYRPVSRRLDFGCAGHPAAVMLDRRSGAVQLLKPKGPPIGLVPDAAYASQCITVPPDQRLYLLSDGAFEVEAADGRMGTFADFLAFIVRSTSERDSDLDGLYAQLLRLRERDTLEDDFSIVRFEF